MKIKLPEKYSLSDTLYPSFILPFFDQNSFLVKKVGRYSGVKIRIGEGYAEVEGDVPREYILEWLGLWFDPRAEAVSEVMVLVDAYSHLRLAVSSCDREYVFVSVFLSQNTDFHVNTYRWISKLSEIYGPEFLKKQGLRFTMVGSSYQLARLEQVYPTFENIKEERDPGLLRLKLLSIKGVGPKIADAYILFSSKHSESTPCDIHLRRFIDRLRLVEYRRLPSKSYCSKYYCWLKSECPVHEECLRFLLMNRYGGLSGWIQTIAYYHDKIYCSKRRCDACPLRELCSLNRIYNLNYKEECFEFE